jgi:hypothetical protein
MCCVRSAKFPAEEKFAVEFASAARCSVGGIKHCGRLGPHSDKDFAHFLEKPMARSWKLFPI